ncbi:hypothetical protein RhoFasK5_02172|nr:hypothetical protein A3Q40_00931 [Rhodococcus sp. PBTS 1]NIL81124.1 hypothetical protein [Rhodococcus kroppenstedtii]
MTIDSRFAGYATDMTTPENDHDTPTLDDVIVPTETPHPDQHEHGKMPHPVDDAELEERTEHEREETGSA